MKFSDKSKILILILSLIIISLFIYILNHNHNDVDKNISKYPYIDISRHLIDQKHYLSTIEPLRKKIRQISQDFEKTGRETSIYIEYLNTGANISINPEKYIFPASLIKVPISMAVMKKVQDGEWKLTNELVLLEGDKDNLSGDQDTLLGQEPVGTRFTIEELLERLIIDSDNTANAILLRNIGEKNLLEVIEALGLDKLINVDGSISSKEYSRVIRSLYSASYLNRENSNYLLSLLDQSKFDDFISKNFQNIPFPHKYGEHIDLRIYADSGIMYVPNRPVSITILVKGDSSIPLEKDLEVSVSFLRKISDEIYSFVSTYNND